MQGQRFYLCKEVSPWHSLVSFFSRRDDSTYEIHPIFLIFQILRGLPLTHHRWAHYIVKGAQLCECVLKTRTHRNAPITKVSRILQKEDIEVFLFFFCMKQYWHVNALFGLYCLVLYFEIVKLLGNARTTTLQRIDRHYIPVFNLLFRLFIS